MATYNNIKKIKIGNNIFNLYDSGNSGGTITSVKTTAGAHTTVNVTSGAVSFNVPTHTSHLTNNSGFITGITKAMVTTALGTGSGTTKFLREDGSWAVPSGQQLSYTIDAPDVGNLVGNVVQNCVSGTNANQAIGGYAHAEGMGTIAETSYCHAEGFQTHAGGETVIYQDTTIESLGAHAEGYATTASGHCSHAEGNGTIASGQYSHAQGEGTIAQGIAQAALGQYNIVDTSWTYSVIIGNGTGNNARSNALAVKWDGNVFMGLDTSSAALSDDVSLYTALSNLGWNTSSDGIITS